MHDALLTDLYELRMVDSYLRRGMHAVATFEFFVRRLPASRGFLVAAGLEPVIDYLLDLHFDEADVRWLSAECGLGAATVEYLRRFRFMGDVHAVPEGTPFFADEPILRVTAPLPAAQLVESRLMNILHFHTLVASKAVRYRLAADGRQLVDFGMRRAHGGEAALWAARSSFLVGFAGTATVLAAQRYRIPLFGTMAHSYVQAFDREFDAFVAFLQTSPYPTTLLVDTYDVHAGVRAAIAAGLMVSAERGRPWLAAIRIDSGDHATLAREARGMLDAAGLRDTRILCSGGLDEWQIARCVAARAPIDAFGVGTSLDVSSDAPALDCAYKLQEYAGIARRKRSAGKATLPGRKQIWRARDEHDRWRGDVLGLEGEVGAGETLVEQVVRGGIRLRPAPSLTVMRERFDRQLAALPERLHQLEVGDHEAPSLSSGLQALVERCDRTPT